MRCQYCVLSGMQVDTYIWNTAVSAPADLWLVDIDEDTWVAKRSAAAVARHRTLVGPADWLLVDEVDGCVWTWLRTEVSSRFSSCLLSILCLIAHLIFHDSLLEPRSNHSL